jgi:hypothetical protein
MVKSLPTEWGTDSDWRCKTVDGITTFLRVTDFANSDDARLFNEWCEANHYVQKMAKRDCQVKQK